MKIGKAIISEIEESTENDFFATYKGRSIYISSDHGYGSPDDPMKKRFFIDVRDIQSGMTDMVGYHDFETIEEAIEYALYGAGLI